MKFKTLQDSLRKTLLARISDGELTGLGLAEKTGFKQAHISNFLNRKRALSIQAMDKVLAVEGLSVLDLLNQEEINQRSSLATIEDNDFEGIFLVEARHVSKPVIVHKDSTAILKFERKLLAGFKKETEGDRREWERFVAMKVDGREGMSMYPRLLPGSIVLIDRFYNSLKPYRRNDQNMYAVNVNGVCRIKYLEISDSNLLLRPQNPAYPIEVLAVKSGKSPSSHIIGRICYVSFET